MPNHDIMVIGASAGGVEAIPAVLKMLPRQMPAAIFAVIHISPDAPSNFPKILSRQAKMPALHPHDGQPIHKGYIYVAPPDRHLMVEENRIRVVRGPRENRHRPAIDPLFRSAALAHGPRVVGTILTGALDDGTEGLEAVKKCGGKAIVQNPEEAVVPGMPMSALRYVEVDHVLSLADIAPVLMKLARTEAKMKKTKACAEFVKEMRLLERTLTNEQMEGKFGAPSSYICPECSGPLWETKGGKLPHYRCLAGHAFSPENLLAGESESIERALWTAVKTLEERASLLGRLANRARELNQSTTMASFREQAEEHVKHANVLRDILVQVVPEKTPQTKSGKPAPLNGIVPGKTEKPCN